MSAMTTWCVVLTVTLGAGTSAVADQSSIDAFSGARQAALEELQQLPSHKMPFGLADPSVLKQASLGTPIVCYWPDSTFLAYESAPSSDLLAYVERAEIRFPVIVEKSVVGTINVTCSPDGICKGGRRSVGSKLVERWTDVRQTLSIAQGQRLSILGTTVAGTYFVIDDGRRIYRMARIESEEGAPDSPRFAAVEDFAPAIKEGIRQCKQRMNDPRNKIDPNEFPDE